MVATRGQLKQVRRIREAEINKAAKPRIREPQRRGRNRTTQERFRLPATAGFPLSQQTTSLPIRKRPNRDPIVIPDEDEGPTTHQPIPYRNGENTTLLSDEDEQGDISRHAIKSIPTATKPLFSSESALIAFIPTYLQGHNLRIYEENLARQKLYGPVWLVRPQSEFRAPFTRDNSHLGDLAGIWVDDCRKDPRLAKDKPRTKDVDALPRWFGPLAYAPIHFNGGRLPRNSLEFFQLCFQPVQEGDMQVWIKYRHIEEQVWEQSWDQHPFFKSFIGDLHAIAFGQKESAIKRVEQMEKAVRMFVLNHTDGTDIGGRTSLELGGRVRSGPRNTKELLGVKKGYFQLATA